MQGQVSWVQIPARPLVHCETLGSVAKLSTCGFAQL